MNQKEIYTEMLRILQGIDEYWLAGENPLHPHDWILSEDVGICEVIRALLQEIEQQRRARK